MVSIVIVTLNSSSCIKECLDSIASQTIKDYEIIVVDNGSTDNTIKILKSSDLPIILNENRENLGFAKGNNQAISLSRGDYILLLNPDVVMSENYIEELLSQATANKKLGAVTGKLLRKNSLPGKDIIDSAGHIAYKCRYFKDRGENEDDKGQYNTSGYVFSVCAAASLYRRKMLEDVKVKEEYFDGDFFSYWEDVDLCWRGQLMGWKCFYNPKAVAYHTRGHSKENNKLEKGLILKNRLLTILKNDSFKNILKDIHHIFAYEFFIFLETLFFYPSLAFKITFQCLKLFPSTFQKRALINQKKIVSDSDIHSWFIYKKNMYSQLLIKAIKGRFK